MSEFTRIAAEIRDVQNTQPNALFRMLVSNGFDVEKRLRDALERDDLTKRLDNVALVLGSALMPLTKRYVATQIILRVWRGDDIDKIVDSLHMTLSKTSERTASCLALAGVSVDQIVVLDELVRIVPASYFPRGTELDQVFRHLESDGAELLGQNGQGWADCALAIEREIASPLEHMPANDTLSMLNSMVAHSAARRENSDLRQVTLAHAALTLAGANAPIRVATFECLLGDGFLKGFSGGLGVYGPRPLIAPPSIAYDFDETRRIFALCKKFADWEAIGVSVQRLMSSRQTNDQVSKAIDMGIALEALLMHGAKRDNTEISNKLRMRAAWLLGADPESRRTVSKVVSDAYAARSKAVHSGALGATEKILAAWPQVDDVCRRLILRVLELGRFPNWDELVVGGEP